MNSTISYTTEANYLDQYYALFVNPMIAIRTYQIGYSLTFCLGFIGNTAGLLTFSRVTLRKISTGCLFVALAISDMLYLLACVFDYLEFGFQVSFYHHVAYSELCRFRSFLMNATQLASAWILVIISIDRWIRTRFPFKSGSLCTPKKALILVMVLIVVDVGLYAQILTPMFGILIPGYVNGACGPVISNLNYLEFYYLVWNTIQIFTTCLIPTLLMLIILLDIFIKVRLRKQALVQPDQNGQNGNPNHHRPGRVQKQMFILMFASISIFFVTNLPLNISKIILPRGQVLTDAGRLTSIWTVLGWFQSLNYAVNFYVHCLSSTFFRQEFKEQMKFLFGRIGLH